MLLGLEGRVLKVLSLLYFFTVVVNDSRDSNYKYSYCQEQRLQRCYDKS